MPGVTHFPLPSISIASDALLTLLPISFMMPSCNRISPSSILPPIPSSIVTLVMITGALSTTLYVLGNGFVFIPATIVDFCSSLSLLHAVSSAAETANARPTFILGLNISFLVPRKVNLLLFLNFGNSFIISARCSSSYR